MWLTFRSVPDPDHAPWQCTVAVVKHCAVLHYGSERDRAVRGAWEGVKETKGASGTVRALEP